MDIYAMLKKDHRKIKSIFKQIEKEEEPSLDTLNNILQQVQQELNVHMRGEEQYLYPVLEQHAEAKLDTLEAMEEHKVAKRILQEMLDMPTKDSLHLAAKMKVLGEVVQHHIKEEEKSLFADAHKVLQQEQVDDISAKYEAEKKKAEEAVPVGA